jgi:hypothetical protein
VLVGGGKAARFTPKSIEEALAGLKKRIQTTNADESAPYHITRTVAFGDFLGDQVRRPVYNVTQPKLIEWADKKRSLRPLKEVSQVAMMDSPAAFTDI